MKKARKKRRTKSITNCKHLDKKHYARGMCYNCYQSWRLKTTPGAKEKVREQTKKWCDNNPEKVKDHSKRKHKKYMKRYHNDPVFREQQRDRHSKYMKKRYHRLTAKDSEYSAKRSRDYRKNHPYEFNKCMAKCYMRKLKHSDRIKLVEELKAEKR